MVRPRYVRSAFAAAAAIGLMLLGSSSPASAALSITNMEPPTLESVQLSGTTATITFTDHATFEDVFDVYRRNGDTAAFPSGLTMVKEVASTDVAGTGKTYTFTDTIPTGTRQCYMIFPSDFQGNLRGWSVSNEMCTSAPPALTVPAEGPGIITTAAPGGLALAGIQNSSTIGTDGFPLISQHVAPGDGTVKLAVTHCSDAMCTSSTTAIIDNSTINGGNFSSIKIGSDGLGIISYQDNSTGSTQFDLKVAHCSNVTCTSATVTDLDSASNVMNPTSLAIASDGRATIVYKALAANNTLDLKVAHCANVTCTSATFTTIENLGNPAGDTDSNTVPIAVSPNGALYIAYQDGSPNIDLKVATCFNADCSNSANVTVDTTGLTGYYPSLAVGRDTLPLVSYLDFNSGNLTIAHCQNTYCSSIRKTAVQASTAPVYSSIAIGGDGFGVVGYYDQTGGDLKVAHCTDLVCSSTTNTIVDEFDNMGRFPSVSIGNDGLPVISYSDSTNLDLKTVHCPNVRCDGDIVAPF